jgi:uncharacterized OB-fold protein
MMTIASAETSLAGVPPFVPGTLDVGPDGKGYLVGGHCPGCGAFYFPARSVCSRCLCGDLERVPLCSSGSLYTYTVIHQSLPQFQTPYILGYVDLDDNVRVAGQLVDVDVDALELGMRLTTQVEPRENADGDLVLWFRFGPAATTAAEELS